MPKRTKTLWGGRFSESPDTLMVEFSASIHFDIELLECDVEGSIAWAEALGKAGVLRDDEVKSIVQGLGKVKENLSALYKKGEPFDLTLEDVHMTVESKLTELIGDTGAKLHTGRSRNDQVALDERLYLFRACDEITALIKSVQKTVVALAERHINSFTPSYTHLQHAQPVRLGHYLMSWFWMLNRDKERFLDARKRADRMPLGAGAAAGSGFAVDRKFLEERLGFTEITENSIDAVSDRDCIIEAVSAASILMMHLSRIAEDLIIWSSAEFGFLALPEAFSTGSSMMPQKKNPDSLELIRGKTGRVFGALMTLLTVMKGLPFSYCRDMQEDKEPLFDTIKTVAGCLNVLNGVLQGCAFKPDVMEAGIDDSVFATDIADYLTSKGLPFRKAHEATGKLVRWSKGHRVPLKEVPLDVLKSFSELFDESVENIFTLETSVNRRSLPGGTGKNAFREQIEKAKKVLLQ